MSGQFFFNCLVILLQPGSTYNPHKNAISNATVKSKWKTTSILKKLSPEWFQIPTNTQKAIYGKCILIVTRVMYTHNGHYTKKSYFKVYKKSFFSATSSSKTWRSGREISIAKKSFRRPCYSCCWSFCCWRDPKATTTMRIRFK